MVAEREEKDGNYITVERLYPQFKIDHENVPPMVRDRFQEYVIEANNAVTGILQPYSDVLPIPQGTSEHGWAQSAAFHYAMQSKRIADDDESRAKMHMEKFEQNKEWLLAAMRARGERKTTRFVVSTNFGERILPLYSQWWGLLADDDADEQGF